MRSKVFSVSISFYFITTTKTLNSCEYILVRWTKVKCSHYPPIAVVLLGLYILFYFIFSENLFRFIRDNNFNLYLFIHTLPSTECNSSMLFGRFGLGHQLQLS